MQKVPKVTSLTLTVPADHEIYALISDVKRYRVRDYCTSQLDLPAGYRFNAIKTLTSASDSVLENMENRAMTNLIFESIVKWPRTKVLELIDLNSDLPFALLKEGCPNLETLEFTIFSGASHRKLDSLLTFLQSSTRLRHLFIDNRDEDAGRFQMIVDAISKHSSTLEHLALLSPGSNGAAKLPAKTPLLSSLDVMKISAWTKLELLQFDISLEDIRSVRNHIMRDIEFGTDWCVQFYEQPDGLQSTRNAMSGERTHAIAQLSNVNRLTLHVHVHNYKQLFLDKLVRKPHNVSEQYREDNVPPEFVEAARSIWLTLYAKWRCRLQDLRLTSQWNKGESVVYGTVNVSLTIPEDTSSSRNVVLEVLPDQRQYAITWVDRMQWNDQ